MRTGTFAGIALSLALAASCATGPSATGVETVEQASARLTAYLDAEYEEELQFSPEEMTRQGRKDKYARLDDRTESAIQRELAWRRKSVSDMRTKFDPDNLNPDARLSYDIWALELQRAEDASAWRRHRYIFSRGGTHTGLPNFLINFHRVDDRRDMDAYIARVALIDNALDQLLVRANAAAADGVHMPGFVYDQALDEVRRVTTGAPFTAGADSALFANGKSKIEALRAAGKISDAEAASYEARLRTAMLQQMKPAYDRVAAFLVKDKALGQTPDKQGALALPNGQAYYAMQLRLSTTTDMSADQIHALGLAQVARVRGEMEAIKTRVGFKGTLQEFFVFMRTDKRFFLPNTDEGRAEYIRLADFYLAGIKTKLPDYFGKLPKADLVVKRVEPFREQPGAAQHYMGATPDGSRPGVFYAHLSDMGAMPTYPLEAIAYHEGLPGHHMQISIQQELTGIAKFRTQTGYSAFSEGWGLYSETLPKEMGFYANPYNDFGRLSAEIWRAIRLVVDTGIHSKGWTQQQAEDYFLANSPLPAQTVKSEIERYILGPGQACSYMIGKITIEDLKAEAKAELGDKFDIRGFHDAVLDGGALPLSVLQAKVRRWIAAQKAS